MYQNEDKTALRAACKNGYSKIVRLLLSQPNIDINTGVFVYFKTINILYRNLFIVHVNIITMKLSNYY